MPQFVDRNLYQLHRIRTYGGQGCGYSPEVRGMSDKPTGVFARGGDIQKQKSLGFKYKIDFATGIKRALDSYSR